MLPLQILSSGLALLSLLLLLMALGSDHWLVASSHLGSRHEGLWRSCLNSVCGQISPASVTVTLKVTRVFMLLAMMAGFLSSFVLLASFLRSHLGSLALTLLSFMGSFIAGLCALIAMVVYTGEFAEIMNVTQGQDSFSWSFGLGWASFPLFLITGVVTLVSFRSS